MYVIVELLVPDDLVPGLHFIVHPALGIDTVDRIHLDATGVDEGRQVVEQLKPLIFQVISGGRRIISSAKPYEP